jgi:hydroxymethylpyrimidine pyrophosphatase-like HAD family hydrolase
MRISGTMASLAGLEQAIEEEDEEKKELAIRRMMLLHGITLSIGGIPLLYLGEEWGMLNDYDFVKDPAKAGDTRWIHRPKMNWEYLEELEVYVTGRHLELVMQAIHEHELPQPDWLICDVGTSLLQRQPSGEYLLLEPYQQHQSDIITAMPISVLQEQLATIDGLQRQEEEKQSPFKLSYYVDRERMLEIAGDVQRFLDRTTAPYSIIQSVDPFTGKGLIDLLPESVSKAYGLAWWSQHVGLNSRVIVYAGDTGNDLAALTAGYRAIVVGNADRSFALQVQEMHQRAGWNDRLYLAREPATSGVLEGCRWFGLV